eukprot:GHVN01105908.1.p1 GENE.GHVN01105908.1~~GHVN01105908.1.p1  ORF type:complete len:166 (+),score=19.55 GHVN01105908.1:223-720(+)
MSMPAHVRKRQQNQGMGAIINNDGDLVTDKNETAEIFAQHYQSVFVPLIECGEPTDNLPEPTLLSLPQVSSELVASLMAKKSKTACGSDGIPPCLLKHLSAVLSEHLSRVFDHSYRTGQLANEWRHSNIIPVFKKKGSSFVAVNYRPIAIGSAWLQSLKESFAIG